MILRTITRLLKIILILVVAALLVGQLLGQPILVGYVTSDSMEPTIDANDGFVAVPAAVTEDPNPGDVIVYEATDGELVTHRVVNETADGYVTRGDANPVTDQDQGDPPVSEDRIVARAMRLGGTVLTIPALGAAAATLDAAVITAQQWVWDTTGIQLNGINGVATALLVISIVGYAVETVRNRHQSALDTRERIDNLDLSPHQLVIAFTLVMMVGAAAAMLVPAGAQSMTLVSSQPAPDGDLIVEPGGTTETTYRITNTGFTPTVVYLESSEGVALKRETVVVSAKDSTAVEATLEAPEETGHFERSIYERRYIHVLPRSVIGWLYGVHPWLPYGMIVTSLGGSAYVFGRLLVIEQIRDRD